MIPVVRLSQWLRNLSVVLLLKTKRRTQFKLQAPQPTVAVRISRLGVNRYIEAQGVVFQLRERRWEPILIQTRNLQQCGIGLSGGAPRAAHPIGRPAAGLGEPATQNPATIASGTTTKIFHVIHRTFRDGSCRSWFK